LAACTSRSGNTAAAQATGTVHAVQMTTTYQFVPAEIRIGAGDTVEWRNVSPFSQTVTAVRGAAPLLVRLPANAAEFDSGIVRPGDTFRYRFTVAGVYQYVSRLANGVDMIGTVLVTERP
jgi:plastocyanin